MKKMLIKGFQISESGSDLPRHRNPNERFRVESIFFSGVKIKSNVNSISMYRLDYRLCVYVERD